MSSMRIGSRKSRDSRNAFGKLSYLSPKDLIAKTKGARPRDIVKITSELLNRERFKSRNAA